MTCGKQVLVEVGSVTPSAASSFYTAALPRAGYQITSNSSGTNPDGSGSMTQYNFTGHGYQGSILASSDIAALPSAGPSALPPISLPSNMTKNVVYINLYPPGEQFAGPSC
jgi:hypothetical protein